MRKVLTMAARWAGCVALACVVALGLVAPAVGAATSSDPKNTKALAALLAAKKLGCTKFSAASGPGSSGGSSSTLPSALSQLALLLQGANLGTCTIGGQQTLLISFPNAKGRSSFEGTLSELPCAIV
jgi:hypothetical protein